jgi:hypothetical protein
MMPDVDPPKERVRQRVRPGMCAAMVAMTVLVIIRPGWTWVPAAFVMTVAALSTIAVRGGLPRVHSSGSGLSGRGRDDHDSPVRAAACPWHMLVAMSRMMPRSAGRRWLAEADSLLAEITATRRGAAIRSYVVSAPRLVVLMWGREVLRRIRLGPRHQG